MLLILSNALCVAKGGHSRKPQISARERKSADGLEAGSNACQIHAGPQSVQIHKIYNIYNTLPTKKKKNSAMMENQTISSYSVATLRQERVTNNAFTSSHTCAELRSWYTSFLLERNKIEYCSCVVRVRS